MRRSGLALFSLLLFAFPSLAQRTPHAPVNCVQLLLWESSGTALDSLRRVIAERGVTLTSDSGNTLQSSDLEPEFLHFLRTIQSPGDRGTPCLGEAAKIGRLIRQKNFEEAETILRKALKKTSDELTPDQSAAIHFALGFIRQAQGDWDGAFDQYTESRQNDPGFPETRNRLAAVLIHSDDGFNAIAEARTALSMDPKNSEAYDALGLGLQLDGDDEAALHAFRESLARHPNNAVVYYHIGQALQDEDETQAAMAAYRSSLRLDPAMWEAHSGLAQTLHGLGKLDEAIAEYREAKRVAPREASVRNSLGNAYNDKHEYDAAIAEFRELFRMSPDFRSGRQELAKALLSKGDLQSAIPELKLALLQNPTASAVHRILGQVFMETDQPKEGLRELRIAAELDPHSALAHHCLGTALFEVQNFTAAAKELREALRLEPSADNHYFLAACLMSMEHDDEALAELEIASSMKPERQLFRARKEELMKSISQGHAQ